MEHFYIYDNAMTEETWSVKDAKESEYGKVLSLMEEYGRVLAHDEVVELMKWVDALSD